MEALLLQRHDACLVVRLNRPERRNAINLAMTQELFQVLGEAEEASDVRVVVLTGGEEVFCAGADLKARMEEQGEEVSIQGDRLIRALERVMSFMEAMGKPVIAAMSGYALGGGLELALACDFRYASETAKLGLPEAKVGTMPGGGGTQRLARLVGPALAKEIMFTGSFLDARQALAIGLVNQVFPVAELLSHTVDVALTIAKRAPLSIRAIKAAVNLGLDMPLRSALAYERACHSLLRGTEDRQEGIRAFLEKREPVFRGR